MRWRHLFRSGELHLATENDATFFRNHLGISTVIDLRDDNQVAGQGIGPLAEPPVSYYHFPLIQDVAQALERNQSFSTSAEVYLMRMREPGFWEGIRQALKVLAETKAGPSVFHCSLGKDRTGQLSAVLLGALGVVDDDIIGDYTLSNEFMGPIFERMRADPARAEFYARFPARVKEARPETMQEVLHTFNQEYGSMRELALAHGVAPSLLRQLEDALLE